MSHFVELVRKYTEVRELTPTIVNEFIKMVIVHAPQQGQRQAVSARPDSL